MDTTTRRPPTGYIVGGVLIALALALGVWALVALLGGSSQPSASASPSASPSTSLTAAATPTTTPEPAPAETETDAEPPAPSADEAQPPSIADFTASTTAAACADDRGATVPLTLSWQVEGAAEAFVGVDVSDAAAQPLATVDATSGAFEVAYSCSREEQLFTLTARNATGAVSSTLTVTRSLP